MAVVLVINDDDDTLDMYESILVALGHVPVTKDTVASGPGTVRDVGADALVVDLQRPGEHEYGMRIIEELRADEATRAIPIVMCTGAMDGLESLSPRLTALGIPIVTKPFLMDELGDAIDDALTGRADRRLGDEPKPFVA